MSPERWEEVKGMVKDKFPPVEERRETLPGDAPGTVEVLEFTTPLGKIRFERTDEPLKLGTKAFASKRIGSSALVVHRYSESERVHRFSVYRWDERGARWTELRGETVDALGIAGKTV